MPEIIDFTTRRKKYIENKKPSTGPQEQIQKQVEKIVDTTSKLGDNIEGLYHPIVKYRNILKNISMQDIRNHIYTEIPELPLPLINEIEKSDITLSYSDKSPLLTIKIDLLEVSCAFPEIIDKQAILNHYKAIAQVVYAGVIPVEEIDKLHLHHIHDNAGKEYIEYFFEDFGDIAPGQKRRISYDVIQKGYTHQIRNFLFSNHGIKG